MQNINSCILLCLGIENQKWVGFSTTKRSVCVRLLSLVTFLEIAGCIFGPGLKHI